MTLAAAAMVVSTTMLRPLAVAVVGRTLLLLLLTLARVDGVLTLALAGKSPARRRLE